MTLLCSKSIANVLRISLLSLAVCGFHPAFGQTDDKKPSMPTDVQFTNSLGMKFVRVESGKFQMGSPDTKLPDDVLVPMKTERVWLAEKGDYDERPAHQVTISKSFYMGDHEVTNQQYEEFDRLHAHQRGKFGFSIDDDEAVVFISWNEATAFCEWLSKKEGLPYRLPTEAEWEYACRAGTTTTFSTGELLPAEFIKNPDSSWYPVPGRSRGRAEVVPLNVGKTQPNAWGLYDMHGNVEEWCLDWYGSYEAGEQVDPIGREDGDFKLTRGGSHGTFGYYLRSANRQGTLPDDKSWYIGFRIVLGETPATKPLPKSSPAPFQQNVKQEIPADVLKGPDPAQPYFHGPRRYVKIAEGSEGPLYSRHNHDAGITECPNGDLLANWYTTVTERGREIAVATSRLRYGSDEWDAASPLWDTPDRNDHCPALYYDGDKTIFHINALSTAATWGPLAIIMRSSTDSGATWSKARIIVPEHVGRHQVIESIIRTKSGAWIIPCDAGPGGTQGTALQVSRDGGNTWTDPGGTIKGIHAGVVELSDGRLMALGRGNSIDDRMPMSISSDLGKTWTYRASPFPPIGGAQRLVLLRMKNGPLFFASFANKDAGGIKIKDASGTERTVSGLYTALSYDDGLTWNNIRLVWDGGPSRELPTLDRGTFTWTADNAEPRGYMAGKQARNGVVHLITSTNHYAFNQKWLETPTPAFPKE